MTSPARDIMLWTGHAFNTFRRGGFHVIAEALAQRGDRVLFMSYPRDWPMLLRQGDQSGAALRALLRGLTLPQGEGVIENRAALGMRLPPKLGRIVPPVQRALNRWSQARAMARAQRWMPDPRWVILESTEAVQLWGRLKGAFPRARFAYRPSDPLAARSEAPEVLKEAEGDVVRGADALLLVNDLARTLYEGRGWLRPDDLRVHILPNGVDLEDYLHPQPRPAAYQDLAGPIVTYVGASGPNWDAIFTAAEALPGHRFVVVCPVRPLPVVAERLPGFTNLRYVPGVPPAAVPGFIQHADVVMIPYPDACRTWARGLHAKVYQAMAARRPIVGLNMGLGIDGHGLRLCEDPAGFVAQLREASGTGPVDYALDVRERTWTGMKTRLLAILDELDRPVTDQP